MKLFTAVLSPCDGIVRAINVVNEEIVESDQTLMIIDATG
jgi:biotin carboxyl carrier protein